MMTMEMLMVRMMVVMVMVVVMLVMLVMVFMVVSWLCHGGDVCEIELSQAPVVCNGRVPNTLQSNKHYSAKYLINVFLELFQNLWTCEQH